LCKYIKRKTKYNKGVTRTEDCLATSHSTTLIVVRFLLSNSVFHLEENWMRDTVLFVLRNRKLDMLVVETLVFHQSLCLKSLCFIKVNIFAPSNVYPLLPRCMYLLHVTAMHVEIQVPCLWEWRRYSIQYAEYLHYLNFWCELNFMGQQIFNVSSRTVQFFTHMKLTNPTRLTCKLY